MVARLLQQTGRWRPSRDCDKDVLVLEPLGTRARAVAVNGPLPVGLAPELDTILDAARVADADVATDSRTPMDVAAEVLRLIGWDI